MASVALSTIYANVLKDLGLNSSDTTWQARATRWTNKALDKAQSFIPIAEFMQNSNAYIATVADQATYSLPADFLQMLHLRDDNNSTTLNELTHGQFDRNHPDPSTESTGKPYEYTLEYDISTGVHILRLAAIPDDAYTLYATMRTFHPTLSGSQDLMYSKLETALEDWAIFEGSLVVFPDNEFVNYRAELKARANESMSGIANLLTMQKPSPRQIPVQMKKGIYNV